MYSFATGMLKSSSFYRHVSVINVRRIWSICTFDQMRCTFGHLRKSNPTLTQGWAQGSFVEAEAEVEAEVRQGSNVLNRGRARQRQRARGRGEAD